MPRTAVRAVPRTRAHAAALFALLLVTGCSGTPDGTRPAGPSVPSSSVPTEGSELIPRSENDPAREVEASGYQPPQIGTDLGDRTVYAAFGDSISSGIGSGKFGYCGRTDGSWVAHLARRDGAAFLNYACVGAKISDLEEQAALIDSSVDVVGVTLLGNDIGVAKVLAGCVSGDCRSIVDDALATARSLLPRAENVLRHLGEGRRIVVSGYASAFSPDHLCDGPLDESDHVELRRAITDLSDLLEEVVADLRSDGVDALFTRPDVSGHELCSDDPWFFPLGAVGALHPTENGQRAMAAAVPVFDLP